MEASSWLCSHTWFTRYGLVPEEERAHVFPSPWELPRACHSAHRPSWQNTGPDRAQSRQGSSWFYINRDSLTLWAHWPPNPLGIFLHLVLLRTDSGLGACLLLLSIPPFRCQWKACGLSLTEKPVSLTSRELPSLPWTPGHIHGVPQMVPLGQGGSTSEMNRHWESAWWHYRS